jgi:hypothetical protein
MIGRNVASLATELLLDRVAEQVGRRCSRRAGSPSTASSDIGCASAIAITTFSAHAAPLGDATAGGTQTYELADHGHFPSSRE